MQNDSLIMECLKKIRNSSKEFIIRWQKECKINMKLNEFLICKFNRNKTKSLKKKMTFWLTNNLKMSKK